MFSNKPLIQIIVLLLAWSFTLVCSAQNQGAETKAMPVITFLLNGERPVVSIPNQGSQPEQTDLLVEENSYEQGTFIVEFNETPAIANALTITNINQSMGIQLSSAEVDDLSSLNAEVQGLSGAGLHLTASNMVDSSTTISYHYDLDGVSFDHSVGPNSIIDRFTIVARNSDGESSPPVDLAILISDIGLAPAPDGSVGMISSVIDAGTGTTIASILTGTGKDAISISGTASDASHIYIEGSHKSIASAAISSAMTNFDLLDGDSDNDFDCVDCLSQQIPTNLSLWVDTVTQAAANYTAHFSRRVATEVTIDLGSGDEQYNASNIVGAYSEDLTPDTSAAAQGTGTITYSKLLGSNPIDQDGVAGTLGTVNLSINFGSQQITAFDINLTTADGAWDAHLPFVTGTTIQDAVTLVGNRNGFSIEGLASDPTGGLTAAGTSTRFDVYGDVQIALLGDGAEGVMLTYNLSVIDALGAPQDAEAVGSVLIEN